MADTVDFQCKYQSSSPPLPPSDYLWKATFFLKVGHVTIFWTAWGACPGTILGKIFFPDVASGTVVSILYKGARTGTTATIL